MSILKNIKNAGLDVFVSYHPIVLKLKREAKTFYKEQQYLHEGKKYNVFSLMQCQEIIAKKYGFNNWHHFFQLIKKHYQVGLENIQYIITTKIEKSDHFLIGYDINFGHYKWQDESSMRTHQCIIGEDLYKEYDTYLAFQAIEKGKEVFFLNGVNDTHTVELLKAKSLICGRENDLKVIDGLEGKKFHNHFIMSSGAITDLIFNCLDNDNSDLFKARTIAFLSGLMMALVYRRDTDNTILSLNVIKDHLNLNNFIGLYHTDLPDDISFILKSYLINLPGYILKNQFNDEAVKIHSEITTPINKTIDKLLELNIFSDNNDSIPMDNLLARNKSIYIINSDNPLKNQFLIALLKINMAMLLGAYLEPEKEVLRMNKTPVGLYTVFLRQVNLMKGMPIVFAQARSLGISVTNSYSSLTKMRELLGQEADTLSLFGNTNTKIISAKEKDAIETISLYHKEHYGNELIPKEPDVNAYVKYDEIRNNYVWVMKRGNVSQISFKRE